jgi:hypothetical protein
MYNKLKKFYYALSLMLEVYIWIILLRIAFEIIIFLPYNSTTRLWFNVTDPAIQLLNKLIPPLYVSGFYLHNVSVILLLLLILCRKPIFKIFVF